MYHNNFFQVIHRKINFFEKLTRPSLTTKPKVEFCSPSAEPKVQRCSLTIIPKAKYCSPTTKPKVDICSPTTKPKVQYCSPTAKPKVSNYGCWRHLSVNPEMTCMYCVYRLVYKVLMLSLNCVMLCFFHKYQIVSTGFIC